MSVLKCGQMNTNHILKSQIGTLPDSHNSTNQPLAGLPHQHPAANGGLLSRAQVAQQLGVCPHTVARNKDLRPLKFNQRLIRYRAEDVQRYIESAIV